MRAGSLISPAMVLSAYRAGAFPMADDRHGRIGWFSPDPRALLPLDDRFRVRRSLAKRVRNAGYRVTFDHCFADVIHACAIGPRPDDGGTWISRDIEAVYVELHHAGYAHSVEAWLGDQLVGGLYGVAIGGAFFGESMFSRRPDASQVCLVRLVEHLRGCGFALLDTQFVNPHLEQFGVVEMPRDAYLAQLNDALSASPGEPSAWRPA
ncbi:MAG: leucyl/phenylalanyl-tRNA--protein transferase [Planctomycetota bacterium]